MNDDKQAAMFLTRMIPFLINGMSFRLAGEAVMRRDVELFEEVRANKDLRLGLSEIVYNKIREVA